MLFNSPEFLFGFLPLVLGVYYLLARRSYRTALNWLVLASLFFYGWWNPAYLLLIGSSILFNYTLARWMLRRDVDQRKGPLVLGIGANLACIGYFKYAGFLSANLNTLLGTEFSAGAIMLPLAISFFTFQQIAFLVDTYQGRVNESHFSRYSLFVLFFPQLIAGPIVHHAEMMPQFERGRVPGEIADNLNRGMTVFAIGLFKKIVLADSLAKIANPAFSLAESAQAMTTLDAWAGATAYTFQLYFDFSGYSDMALGLAIMFGIRLPLNFFSPYRSRSIIEFWRRWHMTLSRFLRDYLYIPLGGNRRGRSRRYINLLITMLLGGLWHGAGWTFVLWGGLHGVFLVINHAWRRILATAKFSPLYALNRLLALPLTFLCVVLAWVYFRAESLEGANFMLLAMFTLGESAPVAGGFSPQMISAIESIPLLSVFEPVAQLSATALGIASLLGAAFVAFCMPNTVEFMGSHHPALRASVPELNRPPLVTLHWQANSRWALVIALLLLACLTSGAMLSPFLYFQF